MKLKVVFTIVSGVLISFLLSWITYSIKKESIYSNFKKEINEYAVTLSKEIEINIEALYSLSILFNSNTHISENKFDIEAERILRRHPNIQALEWIPRVSHLERAQFEKIKKEMLSNFSFTEKRNGVMVRAQNRDEYYPVYYVAPLSGNEKAIGFDLASSPVRLEALKKSRDTGQPTATGSITLVQERGTKKAFLVFLPIYSESPSTIESRQQSLRGFVLGVFKISDIFYSALLSKNDEKINTLLIDKTNKERPDLLFSSNHKNLDSINSDFYYERTLTNKYGRIFKLGAYPDPAYFEESNTIIPGVIFILGVIITGVITTYLMRSILSFNKKIEEKEHKIASIKKHKKELSDKLYKETHKSSAFLNNAPIGVIIVNQSGEFEYINYYAERLFGYKIDEIVGKNISILIPKKLHQTHSIHFSNYKHNPSARYMTNKNYLNGVDKKGEELKLHIYLAPIETENNGYSFMGIIRDVSKEIEQHQLIENTLKEKDLAIDKLKKAQSFMEQAEKMASIGQLAAGVAHEINNPMAFVYANCTMLQQYFDHMKVTIRKQNSIFEEIKSKYFLPDEYSEQWQSMIDEYNSMGIDKELINILSETNEGVQRVRTIVTDLRHFARQSQAEHELVDINECLVHTLNLAKSEFKHRIKIHTEFNKVPMLYCDISKINQVILNILMNAIQAIPDDTDGIISIITKIEKDTISIEIKDNGKGIKQENIDKIFDPFFTTKPIGDGTGLGLSICYGIIQEHNGNITVQSQLGIGSVFNITLPYNSIEKTA